MTPFRHFFLVLFLGVLALPLAAQRGSDRLAELGFVVGEAYPDIVLPRITSGGEPGSIADQHGKPVLVLHFASW